MKNLLAFKTSATFALQLPKLAKLNATVLLFLISEKTKPF